MVDQDYLCQHRRTIEVKITHDHRRFAHNMVVRYRNDIRVAVPYYKPSRNELDWEPHYYLHSTDAWLKYPHSLEGLSAEEIKTNRPALYEILQPHLSSL